MKETVTNIDILREIALDQHGFVTAQQALQAGVSKPALSMLTKRERIDRVAHGIYRIPQIPITQYAQYMLAVLWTGAPEAALSHETALDAYEVSDINPSKTHITVAKRRRIKRSGGKNYALHYQDLLPDQIAWWEQIPIVTLAVALEQCIAYKVPDYILEQGISNGRKRGLLTAEQAESLSRQIGARNEQYFKANRPQ